MPPSTDQYSATWPILAGSMRSLGRRFSTTPYCPCAMPARLRRITRPLFLTEFPAITPWKGLLAMRQGHTNIIIEPTLTRTRTLFLHPKKLAIPGKSPPVRRVKELMDYCWRKTLRLPDGLQRPIPASPGAGGPGVASSSVPGPSPYVSPGQHSRHTFATNPPIRAGTLHVEIESGLPHL